MLNKMTLLVFELSEISSSVEELDEVNNSDRRGGYWANELMGI